MKRSLIYEDCLSAIATKRFILKKVMRRIRELERIHSKIKNKERNPPTSAAALIKHAKDLQRLDHQFEWRFEEAQKSLRKVSV